MDHVHDFRQHGSEGVKLLATILQCRLVSGDVRIDMLPTQLFLRNRRIISTLLADTPHHDRRASGCNVLGVEFRRGFATDDHSGSIWSTAIYPALIDTFGLRRIARGLRRVNDKLFALCIDYTTAECSTLLQHPGANKAFEAEGQRLGASSTLPVSRHCS